MTVWRKAGAVCALLFLAMSSIADDYEGPSKEDVLAAIETLRSAPLSPEAVDASAIIMDFAHLSDAVDVKLNMRYTPWARGHIPELIENKLIAAFVGGNMEPQLRGNQIGHRPYEGTVMQLLVYRALRDKKLAPKINRLERLIAFQDQGVLKEKVR